MNTVVLLVNLKHVFSASSLQNSTPAAPETPGPGHRKSAPILQNGLNANRNMPYGTLHTIYSDTHMHQTCKIPFKKCGGFLCSPLI